MIKELIELYKSSTPEGIRYLHGSIEQIDERVQEFREDDFPFVATLRYPTFNRVSSQGRANQTVRQLMIIGGLVSPEHFDKLQEDRIIDGDFKEIEDISEQFEEALRQGNKVADIKSWNQTYEDNLIKSGNQINQNLNFIFVDFTFEYYAKPC